MILFAGILSIAAANGMPVYAECGGLMALTEYLVDLDGKRYPMIGLLPGHTQMVKRLSMGYREVVAVQDSPVLEAGNTARGHEFHYSDWVSPAKREGTFAYQIKPRTGNENAVKKEGFVKGNILASYVHLHFASNPVIADRFVNACKLWRDQHTRS